MFAVAADLSAEHLDARLIEAGNAARDPVGVREAVGVGKREKGGARLRRGQIAGSVGPQPTTGTEHPNARVAAGQVCCPVARQVVYEQHLECCAAGLAVECLEQVGQLGPGVMGRDDH